MKYRLIALAALAALSISCNPVEEETYDDMQGLIINEVSPSKSMGKEAWIEICNNTEREINLKGLNVVLTTDSVTEETIATLKEGKIEAGGRYVISSKDVEFSAYMLRSTFEEVCIVDHDGSPINSFSVKYDLQSTAIPEDGSCYARIPDKTGSWTITSTPTPGNANYKIVPHDIGNFIFNEVSREEKWVEIVNVGTRDVPLEYSYIKSKDGSVIFTAAPGLILKAGERLALDCQCEAASMADITYYSNQDKKIVSFSADGLGQPGEGQSWSRLPDVSGEWRVAAEATKGTVNMSVTTNETGLVINEASLAGWVEIANTTVEQIKTKGIALKADGKQVYASGAATIPAGGKIVASVDVSAYSSFVLYSNAGEELDRFSKSDVRKDSRAATTSTSWSRLPDGTGKWFTVLTPSKGEDNYGIEVGNTVAIWVNQSSTNSIKMADFCKLGIGNIILHEWSFKNYGEAKVKSLVSEAEALGMKVHIWLQCFWWNDDTQWRCPVIDKTSTTKASYNQALFDEVINRALTYEKAGVHGIHFDYVRFPGSAAKHTFTEDGITGIGAITEFCRQANAKLKAQNPAIILSAALMGERNAQSYYGQDPAQMSQYIDILMPMAYISSYNYSSTTNVAVANWFADRCGNGQVWHGISTYNANTQGLSAEEIYRDCQNITGSRAHGIALFRHGIGDVPNLTGMFAK